MALDLRAGVQPNCGSLECYEKQMNLALIPKLMWDNQKLKKKKKKQTNKQTNNQTKQKTKRKIEGKWEKQRR
jgi:hypothetical protein